MLRNLLTTLLFCSTTLAQAAVVDSKLADAQSDFIVIPTIVAGIQSQDAKNRQRSLTQVRALFSMEDTGARNSYPELGELKALGEYVVNCGDQSLAIAEFRVLKTSDSLPVSKDFTTEEKLTYSSPKFDAEVKLVRAACGSSVASLSSEIK